MAQEPRKATDVLLSLENKINQLISIFQSLDLNVKIVSNKLNDLLAVKDNVPPTVLVETANNTVLPSVVPIAAQDTLPLEAAPNGFRRTSRPETFAGDNSYLNRTKKVVEESKFPIQVPKGNTIEVIVQSQIKEEVPQPPPIKETAKVSRGTIPVSQRIVDKNGKSIFLADVNIIDANTAQSIFTTRTNGIGRWAAALAPGNYTIVLRKKDSLTKEPLELTQNIQVDGTKSPFDLPVCIIRN